MELWPWRLLVIVLVASGCFAWVREPLLAGEGKLSAAQRAQVLLEQGRTPEAITLLKEHLAGRPPPLPSDKIELYARLALAYQAESDLERCVEAFLAARDAAIEHTGKCPRGLLFALAEAKLGMSDAEGAWNALDGLGSTPPVDPEEALLLASIQDQRGNAGVAEKLLRLSVTEQPSSDAAHALGVRLFERGDYEEALEAFETSLRLTPPGDSARPYYTRIYRARTFLKVGRLEDALNELEGLPAESPEVSYLRGMTLARLDRTDAAVDSFHEALKLDPTYAEALFGLSAVLQQLGQSTEAREHLKKFRVLQREIERRDREQMRLLQEVLRQPRVPELRERLGEAALAARNFGVAESNLWHAVRLQDRPLRARLLLARTYLQTGRYQAAAVQYRRILQAEPEHQVARVELEAMIIERGGRPEGRRP